MGRVIGNEIFKTIVTMAYEMGLAQKVLGRMARRREKVIDLMRAGQTFRDNEDILKDITKYLAISPDNKKHWRFDEEVEDGYSGFVLKKEIPMSVSGPYRIMLSIVKHTEYEVAQHRDFWNALYVHVRDSDGEVVNDGYDTQYVMETPPTVFTVALVERLGLCLEFSEIEEAYDAIFEGISCSSGINARAWNRRLHIMRDGPSDIVEKIRRRYVETV